MESSSIRKEQRALKFSKPAHLLNHAPPRRTRQNASRKNLDQERAQKRSSPVLESGCYTRLRTSHSRHSRKCPRKSSTHHSAMHPSRRRSRLSCSESATSSDHES